MCGFLAEFNLNDDYSDGLKPTIDSNAEAYILRRGPDGLQKLKEENFEISFARLAITDIEHGVQPFYTTNGFLAFGNGEIYNSYEISNQLELSTDVVTKIGFNDIKIAAELLSIDPRRNWEKLDGMFSICLYSPKGEIYFGRDRVGEKPAFYYVSGSRLIVGSSAEAVAKQVGGGLEIDSEQLNNWLAFGGCDPGSTLFSEIKEVRPGTVRTFQNTKADEFTYWEWPVRGSRLQLPDNYFTQITQTTERCRSKDFDGCLLWSGGVDSTVLRASLSLNGFTPDSIHISFKEKSFNEELPELPKNDQVSKISTALFEDWVSKPAIETAITLMDQPISDAACLPMLAACMQAKKNYFKVVYTGDGADEVFRGYEAIKKEKYLLFITTLLSLLPNFFLIKAIALLSKTTDSSYISKVSIILRLLTAASVPKSKRKQILVSPNFYIASIFQCVLATNKGQEPVSLEKYFQDFILPQIYLQKTDRMSAGIGLEARSPWLSLYFIQTSMSLSQKLLKKMGKPFSVLLPDHDNWRRKKKHGLGVPLTPVLELLQKPCWEIPNLPLQTLDEIWFRAQKGSNGAQSAAWSLYVLNEKLYRWKMDGILR
jgi:asparagine synthase (glutamine-hydrolysing)